MLFIREFLLKPFVSLVGIASGVIGTLAFLLFPPDAGIWIKLSFVGLVIFFILFVNATMVAYKYHQMALRDGKVRAIRSGDFYYTGHSIIILDKANWITTGGLLTLYIDRDEVRLPIAIMRVDTINDAGFPQCVVLYYLSGEDMSEYVMESGLWKSMIAQPIIMFKHIEGYANA